ncbi:zinc-dependent metalloprotease [Pseudemcibacter aquimaris]|uniref:zinc-dependent metalloprotease n=1 Tax=Pseudemcibacter aquimaris TaxID=2857064 RepID=UPI00201361AA|nr:zinc-dependent metalloprotease [Pseudemcibacter aquimaris]WDU59981.1 zinc-dependent metalloprotease [Pseudemcibacter aquimaris]
MRKFASILLLFVFSTSAFAQDISDFTRGMEKKEGFFNVYSDHENGKVYLEVDRVREDFIYKVSLPGALGSNDIGLDRGQLGGTKLVYFDRVGKRVFLHQKNTRYTANSDNPRERLAATNAFAPSIVFAFDVVASDGDSSLIEISEMMLDDQHRSAAKIKRNNQGDFSLDKGRSFVDFEFVKTFPMNTELQSVVSFKGENPGGYVRSVAANANIITLKQRISFVELPDDNYKPRRFHPAMSSYKTTVVDYATSITEPIEQNYVDRHRLIKKNPDAEVSEAVEPIVYYIDSGAPELIRNALRDGVQWWNAAFEAAGFKDAFRAEIMPEGMDPDDVRYNVVNWVHRSTRGWSYGGTVFDPRTGEIIKGHVTLGSLRSRQDFMIANAVSGPYKEGGSIDDSLELVLARTRQLGAHEVGHTLGFAHNYIASMFGDDDVMDYPHPQIKLDEDGNVSIKNAYDNKIGEWNKIAVNWAYREFANEEEEAAGLKKIMEDAYAKGHKFIADGPDSRGAASLHADSHLWDFGDDVLQNTRDMYEVRRVALSKFGLDNIADGTPLAQLEETLVPLYYLPRFQINAASKSIGGMIYGYEVKGENIVPRHSIVSRARQDEATDIVLEALSADYLTLPKHILDLIPPKAFGYSLTRESFPRDTGASFDALGMVEAHANHTLGLLFNKERLARINDHNVRDNQYISLDRYIVKIASKTILAPRLDDPLKAAVHRRVGYTFVHYMMMTAGNKDASPAAQAMTASHLNGLKGILEDRIANDEMTREYKAFYQQQARRIGAFLAGDYMPKHSDLAPIPPGEPI